MKVFKEINKYVLVFSILSGVAQAQVIPGYDAPELKTKTAVDSNGIDLISGGALIPGVNMSIGDGENGIAISDSSFNGMRNKYRGQIVVMQSTGSNNGGCDLLPSGQYFDVSTSEGSAVFKYIQGADPQLIRGRGSLKLGADILYRSLNGTEYKYSLFTTKENFIATWNNTSECVLRRSFATLTKITKPNGEVIDITYSTGEPFQMPSLVGYPSPLGWFTTGYLVSIKSSLGWMFKRDFISESGTVESSAGKTYYAEYRFLNSSVDYCDPTASGLCSGLSSIWPKFKLQQNYSELGSPKRYSYNGTLENALGKSASINYSYLYSDSSFLTTLISPSGIQKKYTKWCFLTPLGGNNCGYYRDGRVTNYSQGSASFSYGTRSLEPSSYANQSIVMHESYGPEGKVWHVPVLSEYPFSFYDNLSRTYTNKYQTNADPFNSKWLLEEVGYASDTRTKASFDSRGNITTISQIAKNNAGTIIISSMTYPDESTCSYSPKTCNKPTTITDQNGVTTTYTYHTQSGYVETATKPSVGGVQAQVRYKYEQKYPYVKNSSGSLVANPPVWVLTEVSECMTQSLSYCVGTADEKRIIYSDFTNNLLSQKTTIQDGTGAIRLETFTEYDIYGNVISVDGPRTGTDDKVFYFYDLMRQKIGEIGVDPDGSGALPRQAVRTVYNGDGKVTSIEKGVVYGTSKSDLDAMQTKEQATTEYSTDHGLPIVERFYAAGVLEKVTQKSYDNQLQLDCVARRLNRNAWSSLPASACTLGSTGSEGNDRITKYNYDATGAVLSTISAYGAPLQRVDRTNTYSSVNGLLTTEADGKGNTTFYKYDDFNRLWKTVYPTPSNGTVESTTDYTQTNYKSGSSHVGSVRLRDGGQINFHYDILGRVHTKEGAGIVENFSYNNFNQVKSRTSVYNGSAFIQTAQSNYNALGWLLSEARSGGAFGPGNGANPNTTVSYGYDSYGRRTSLTWPDNFSVVYDYNVNGIPGELLRKITEPNGTLLAEFDYYDNGRRKSLRRGNGVMTSYQYNDLQQLKSQATDVGGSNTADDISENFTYALSGQLKTHSLGVANSNYIYTPSSGVTTNYVPDALNRIASTNGVAFTYDGRGNLTQDNTGRTYTYNANNLLLSTVQNGVTTNLGYDAQNRLFSTIKSGVVTRFIYDGTDLIAETDANNNILRRYVHGPETDDPIVWYEGSGTSDRRYYTANRQGSIVGVTTQSGLSTAVNSYDEYGIQKLTAIGRFQYTGQTWLPEVGLYYYKARLYSPSLGRFMQTDPIGYKDGMNWYAYGGNDPVSSIDPNGMKAVGLSFGISVQLPPPFLFRGAYSGTLAFDTNNWDVGIVGSSERGIGLGTGLGLDLTANAVWTEENMGIDSFKGNSINISGSGNTPFYGLGPNFSINYPASTEYDEYGGADLINDTTFNGKITELGINIGLPGLDGGVTIQNSVVKKTSILGDVIDFIKPDTANQEFNQNKVCFSDFYSAACK